MLDDRLFSDIAAAVDEVVMLSVHDGTGTITHVNANFCAATGFSEADLIGRRYRDVLGYDGEPACDEIAAALAGHRMWQGTLRQRHRDGGPFWSEALFHPCVEDGRLRQVVAIQRDVTRTMQAEKALHDALDLLDEAQRLAHVGSWEWDFATDRVTCSREALRIFGLPTDVATVPFGIIADRMHPNDRTFVVDVASEMRKDGQARKVEFRAVLDGGIIRNVSVEARAVCGPDGDIVGLGGTTHDITDRVASARNLKNQALRDPLTGLYNRRVVEQRLEEAMAGCATTGTAVAVLFLDMDGFKDTNDRLGHGAGDDLLCEVAGRLQRALRATDVVGRVGGDEFVVLLEGLTDPAAAVTVAADLAARLQEPWQSEETWYAATVSIGIAIHPEHGQTAQELLRAADLAMYRVKETGRNNVIVYEPDWGSRSSRRLQLLDGLRHALAAEEFEVHYQPQVCLTSNRILSLEALLRWRSKDLGMVSPAEFIPLLEETGGIVAVGRWVLETACRDIARWAARGHPVRVAVNLSYAQIVKGDLVPAVEAALAETGIDPDLLELELTESMFAREVDLVVQALEACQALGLSIAVDDFGIGYSSLGHLKRFPVDVLKVDKVFTEDVHRRERDAALLGAMVSLARSLGLRVVAEGIEEPEAVAVCRDLGCDLAQGFYFSRPVPADQVEPLLCAVTGLAGSSAAE